MSLARIVAPGGLVCREYFSDGDCARPAQFSVGSNPAGGYPACERCAEFWAPEYRVELTAAARRRLEEAWASVPIEGPSELVKRTPAHRRAVARERAGAA